MGEIESRRLKSDTILRKQYENANHRCYFLQVLGRFRRIQWEKLTHVVLES